MSKEYEGQDLLDIALKAEKDLNSDENKSGTKSGSTSTEESGIDTSVTRKFPGSTAEYGSHASGAGDNRDIPESEGGDIQKGTGRLTKAGDFDKGEAGEGPEDVARREARDKSDITEGVKDVDTSDASADTFQRSNPNVDL